MHDRAKPSPRFHGRVPGDRPCAEPGCAEVGEFRVPGLTTAGFDGPGTYRWMCLDHVREFNARYNFFNGMSADEIVASQSPHGGWAHTGWASETRAFSQTGADLPPKWSDFSDPMDALGARFRAAKQRAADSAADFATNRAAGASAEDRAAFAALGLSPGADRHALRKAYAERLRRYHPDRNGGDRSHEEALGRTIAAYQRLRR